MDQSNLVDSHNHLTAPISPPYSISDRVDIDEDVLQTQPPASVTLDDDEDIESLTIGLKVICNLASTTYLDHQPKATRFKLIKETGELFQRYGKHGSQARLSLALMKFLEKGKTVFNEEDKLELIKPSSQAVAEAFQNFDQDSSDEEDEEDDKERIPFQDAYGSDFEPRNLLQKSLTVSNSPPIPTHKPATHPCRRAEPEVVPAVPPSSKRKSVFAAEIPKRKTRSIDQDTNRLVANLPFNPIDTIITIPPENPVLPYLLPPINRLFELHTVHARTHLHHLISRYGPEPIFRAGISGHTRAQLATLFTSAADDSLGMGPETRRFLRGVYETHGPELNIVETALLARVAGVGTLSVDLYWADETRKRQALWGSRIVVARKELEKGWKEERDKRKTEMRRLRREACLVMAGRLGLSDMMEEETGDDD